MLPRSHPATPPQALKDLNTLLEESDTRDLIDTIDLESLLNLPITSTSSDQTSSVLKKKSDLYPPPSANQGIATFLKLTTQEVKDMNANTKSDNLTTKEKQALEQLSNNPDLVIKPSAKGGNIVLMSNDKYISMCIKILNNTDWYKPIKVETITRFNEEFYILVDRALNNNIITNQLWKFVRTPFPVIPTFYSLPKIHKNRTDPPGRPIVSGNGSITENLS